MKRIYLLSSAVFKTSIWLLLMLYQGSYVFAQPPQSPDEAAALSLANDIYKQYTQTNDLKNIVARYQSLKLPLALRRTAALRGFGVSQSALSKIDDSTLLAFYSAELNLLALAHLYSTRFPGADYPEPVRRLLNGCQDGRSVDSSSPLSLETRSDIVAATVLADKVSAAFAKEVNTELFTSNEYASKYPDNNPIVSSRAGDLDGVPGERVFAVTRGMLTLLFVKDGDKMRLVNVAFDDN
jgi:hypothetical protein